MNRVSPSILKGFQDNGGIGPINECGTVFLLDLASLGFVSPLVGPHYSLLYSTPYYVILEQLTWLPRNTEKPPER